MDRLQSPHTRNVRINGCLTSITVEAPFWDEFRLIVAEQQTTIDAMLAHIDRTMRLMPKQRPGRHRVLTLSAAVRIFVLKDVMSRCTGTSETSASDRTDHKAWRIDCR